MFRKLISLTLFISFFLAGCDNNSASSKFYDDGRSKPVLALNSVIDSTAYDLSWNLSDELTNSITKNLSLNKDIFVNTEENVDKVLGMENPFSLDLNWMKNKFEQNEFVVFMELIKHEDKEEKNGVNLDMAMRVRIIDLRAKTPKVVLQECIKDNFFIAKGDFKEDYTKVIYGSNEYSKSRMGLAHEHLAKNISDRISDYISLVKSR